MISGYRVRVSRPARRFGPNASVHRENLGPRRSQTGLVPAVSRPSFPNGGLLVLDRSLPVQSLVLQEEMKPPTVGRVGILKIDTAYVTAVPVDSESSGVVFS